MANEVAKTVGAVVIGDEYAESGGYLMQVIGIERERGLVRIVARAWGDMCPGEKRTRWMRPSTKVKVLAEPSGFYGKAA
jgi:hypothetical protein